MENVIRKIKKKEPLEFVYKLFKYKYSVYCQGDRESSYEYALLNVPKDATFNNNRSVLMNKRSKEFVHEIDIESVVDLSINF